MYSEFEKLRLYREAIYGHIRPWRSGNNCLSRKSAEILATSPINTYGGDGFIAQSLAGKATHTQMIAIREWAEVPKVWIMIN